jgi:putative endonuclease
VGQGGSTRDRGRAVEQFVAQRLAAEGIEILDRNFEAAGAEVDLVGRTREPDGAPLYVFVEIRSRSADERGSPLETVDRAKQRRIIRGATQWLVARDLWEKVAVRFDVVGVVADGSAAPRVEWIPGAFETS